MFRCLGRMAVPALACIGWAAAAQSPPQPAAPPPTLRFTSNLVVVDVVVTDSGQNPVHGLTKADFKVLEDGHPEIIKAFEEHQLSAQAPLGPMLKLDRDILTNDSPVPENGALNILLFDKLNTPMDAQAFVRDQVIKDLKQIAPGTRMAIFTLTIELRLLEGLRSNPEVLRALVEGKKVLASASALMNHPVSGDQPGTDDPMMDLIADNAANDPDIASMEAHLEQFEAVRQSFQLQLRARDTLDVLNLLGRYLNRLPGRKNLIWSSGSFPISILPDPDLQNPFIAVASAEDEFRQTTALLARSQVAVYPIDARGLMPWPWLNAANSGPSSGRSPTHLGKDMAKFSSQTADERGTMNQMAEATGGRAFENINDLKGAIERAMAAGSNYDTVAYTPENGKWDGRFRKIQVQLERPGVTLAYRRGYDADDPNGSLEQGDHKPSKDALPAYRPMSAAMLHGAPDPTEILFLVRQEIGSALRQRVLIAATRSTSYSGRKS
jgi:VWFA-related protein